MHTLINLVWAWLIRNAVLFGSTKYHVLENLKVLLTIRLSWKHQLRKIQKNTNFIGPFYEYGSTDLSLQFTSHNASNIKHKVHELPQCYCDNREGLLFLWSRRDLSKIWALCVLCQLSFFVPTKLSSSS